VGGLSDIFNLGMEGFVSYLINSILNLVDNFLADTTKVCFFAQDYLTSDIGMNVSNVFQTIRIFGYYLIVLKLLIKGFNTYILWSDGDPDMDPFILATGFYKAIIVAISFDYLYGYMIDIAIDLLTQTIGSINNVDLESVATSDIVSIFIKNGLGSCIMVLIYVGLYVYLWITFIKRGIDLLVLRMGAPIAATGLMDSDGGVFKAFLKKFIQIVFTVLVQILFLKLSIAFMLNGHLFYGIAAMLGAMKTPQLLQDFMLAYGGGQGAVSKATQAAYTARMFYGFVK
jgi:hypothetical protein